MTTAALRTRSARRRGHRGEEAGNATLAGQRETHRHGYRRGTVEPRCDGDHRRSVSAHDRCRRNPRLEARARTALIAWSTRSSVGRRWGSHRRQWRWPVSIGSSISEPRLASRRNWSRRQCAKRHGSGSMPCGPRPSANKLLHRTAAAGSAVSQRSLAAAAVQPHVSVVSARAAVVV